ncbi:MAG: hypothetical protein CHKLHMKO_00144 [Candidatus Argoarchaeum ethanivorans]|uniref:Cohesin domain-containing protein n=1 Tax=Candidatus Argoarchaeum ethanivorans TaxID=2608793 RepID=A0A811T7E4_9EURY|nr:MAG: hypothetical protein CHKLHMKO_00144 [Candidatus Argoarchaeum ethanivorans]
MNQRTFTRLTKMRLITLTFFLLILVPAIAITSAEVTGLNTPQEVVQGKEASISGKASPNEAVWLSSSFVISLPVSDGKYSCDFTDIHFPAGEKTFLVTAENVKNIRASLSPVFWQTIEYPLSGPEKATANSIATLSISFPATMHGAKIDISGKKNVKVYGDAAEGATSVNLKSGMSIKVTADSNGDFLFNISTVGAPTGEFLVITDGIENIISVVSAEVRVDNITAEEGRTINASILIKVAGEKRLSYANITLNYNPSIVDVEGAGGSDFDSFRYNVPSKGCLRMLAYQTGAEGLKGDIKFAEIKLKAVGKVNESSELELEVRELNDNKGHPVHFEVEDGHFLIKGGEGAVHEPSRPFIPTVGVIETIAVIVGLYIVIGLRRRK